MVTPAEDRPAPPPKPRAEEPSRAWIGVLAVAFGALLMLAGVAGVYLYARRHPLALTTSSASAPLPPPVPVPPPLPVAPAPPIAAPSAPATAELVPPTLVVRPFPEDAAAPVPVQFGHPLWGARDAPVTLTVFADLECPHSVPFVRTILSEKARRGDKLRLAFRHLPLSQHQEGTEAARALAEIHSARGEPAFWRALAEIVRSGQPLEPGALGPLLAGAGLSAFPSEPAPAVVESALEEDAVLAVRLFVRSTPTVFVNGTRLEGFQTAAVLSEAVTRELQAAYLTLASGVAPNELYSQRAKKNLLNLGDDPPGRACVPAGDSPAQGAAEPLVEFVEFTDLECELCREGEAALAKVFRGHAAEMRVVWKNFPLPQHPLARKAASFALEARRAGGDTAFFAVTSALLERGAAPDENGLARAAQRAKVDLQALLAAAEGGAHEARIAADLELARTLGLTGAPTYFVNGRKIAGAVSAGELEAIVRAELALARKVRAKGAGNVAELACAADPVP
ncbi:MAG TPA: thioredoxin domain-containing protein [Polyangiaceae bacterium]